MIVRAFLHRLPIAAWLVVGLAAISASVAVPAPAVAPGDKAPSLSAPPIGGEAATRVRWADASLTVVNYWATWCAPCRSEMPALDRLRKERAGQGLAVYGVMLDTASDEAALKFVGELGIGYPVLRGSVELSDLWGGIGLMPTTFLVDAEGIVRRRYVGATSELIARMQADIATLLESAAPAGTEAPPPTKAPASED